MLSQEYNNILILSGLIITLFIVIKVCLRLIPN